MKPIEFIEKHFPEFYDKDFINKLTYTHNVITKMFMEEFGTSKNTRHPYNIVVPNPHEYNLFLLLQHCMIHHKPDNLYHYTSVESLSSILKNESLWLFHYPGMNDPHEITHGIKCIQDCIEEMFDNKEISKENAIAVLKSISSELGDDEENTTCFSSFMTKSDYLPYWRWYGNDGKGVCIEFKTDRFKSNLYKVLYDEKAFKELTKYVLNDIGKAASILGGSSILIYLISIAKANYYKEEEEWRIIEYHKSLEKIFINGRKKKYTELKLDTNNFPITKVIIGPSASQESKEYICELLDNEIKHDIDIECSNISYNNKSILFEATLEHRTKLFKKLGAI